MTVFKTIEEMQDFLSEMAKNPAAIKDIDLSMFRFHPEPIVIKIDGEGYDSCIDTDIMKHFVDMQMLVYDYIKIAKYGSLGKRLSEEDKICYKIRVQVKPGCTELIADFVGLMENLFVNMNGWQALGATAVVAGCVTLYGILKVRSDNKAKVDIERTKVDLKAIELEEKKEEHKHEVEVIQAITSTVDNTLRTSHEFFSTFAEMNARISIDNEEISKKELREISTERLKVAKEHSKAQESVVTRYVSGTFVVESLNFKDGCTTVNLRNTKTNELYTNVNLGGESLNEQQAKLATDAMLRKTFDFEIAINETEESGTVVAKGIKGVSEGLIPGLIKP